MAKEYRQLPEETTPTTSDWYTLQKASNNQTSKVSGTNLLPAGSVTPVKLMSGTGTTWVGQTWAIAFGNLSGGTLNYAKYTQFGKLVFFRWKYTLAGAGVAGEITFSTPTTMVSDMVAGNEVIPGSVLITDTGTGTFVGNMNWQTSTTIRIRVNSADTTNSGPRAISSTVPMTWANTDVISVSGFYESA